MGAIFNMVKVKNITSEREFESFNYYDYSFAKNINTACKFIFKISSHTNYRGISAGSAISEALQISRHYINLVDCKNYV